jgi:hypothetical protein
MFFLPCLKKEDLGYVWIGGIRWNEMEWSGKILGSIVWICKI